MLLHSNNQFRIMKWNQQKTIVFERLKNEFGCLGLVLPALISCSSAGFSSIPLEGLSPDLTRSTGRLTTYFFEGLPHP